MELMSPPTATAAQFPSIIARVNRGYPATWLFFFLHIQQNCLPTSPKSTRLIGYYRIIGEKIEYFVYPLLYVLCLYSPSSTAEHMHSKAYSRSLYYKGSSRG